MSGTFDWPDGRSYRGEWQTQRALPSLYGDERNVWRGFLRGTTTTRNTEKGLSSGPTAEGRANLKIPQTSIAEDAVYGLVREPSDYAADLGFCYDCKTPKLKPEVNKAIPKSSALTIRLSGS